MTTGAAHVRGSSGRPSERDAGEAWRRPLLFVDGDLEETAANVGVLVAAGPRRAGPT